MSSDTSIQGTPEGVDKPVQLIQNSLLVRTPRVYYSVDENEWSRVVNISTRWR